MFRYFRDPHHFSTYVAEDRTCDICGSEGPGYEGPFYGADDSVEFVCEACLASGQLEAQDVSTNDAGTSDLDERIARAHPDYSKAQVRAAFIEKAKVLMYRTPRLISWQDMTWPAHCTDFCCFIKEVGKQDLNGLAPDSDGRAFLTAHLADQEAEADELWDAMRPDAPRDLSKPYSTAFYLFQCLECGTYVIHWDCE
jgi:uncharacterized protein